MDNRLKGILSIVASAFGFALMAAFVRLCDDFGAPVSSFQKSFFRNIVALAVALAVFASRGRGAADRPTMRDRLVILLRSLLGTIGIFANFYALSHIPIAEGQTLNKTAPFFTIVFAWLGFGERASLRQIAALALAFAGVLFIVRPGFAGEAAFPLGIGLASGACAGGAYACVRYLGRRGVDGALIILVFSVFSCLASVPFMIRRFDPMTTAQTLTLLGAGAGAAVGQFGITAAYRFAPPRSIAVFDYSSILFAALFGWMLFEQLPDAVSVVGMALIVAAAGWMCTGAERRGTEADDKVKGRG